MEYFIFSENGGEPKVTGIRNGTGQVWFDDDFWLNNPHIKKFMWPEGDKDLRFSSGIQPEFSLDLIGISMDKMAKHTDLIYFSALLSGLVVSTRFREVLEQFHLPTHHYYKVKFHQPDRKTKELKEVSGYWYLYFEKETGEHTVDFALSKFDTSFHTKYLDLDEGNLLVNSYEDYLNILFKTGTALKARELVFNKNFDQELDLWGCRFLSVKDYVSERLLKAMKGKGITNIRETSFEQARRTAKMVKDTFCELVFL